jgi:hypothetical protein
MAIRSETRTTHTITIDLPDDVLGAIAHGDEVEVMFNSRTAGGPNRTPRPMRLSYSMVQYLLGDHSTRF